ncbi:MAG: tRNA pseudouridine(38-40) synthase TruA [Candidatus Omnitrophica bacterium]|jgi:tRNA pseudouridine38-40 synthase|nr:tRNA pseudouridine(38-40) synthase TruA [Candidatus Omnitrophota bacterium]
MQKNILLEIEYLGTNYYGFQLQNKAGEKEITVQEVLERAIRKLFKKKIRIAYASRTDRGVHAKGQVVNFKVDTVIPLKKIKNALNAFLPDDVRVKKIKIASDDFHSRFKAKSKIYRYIIFNKVEPTVFWLNFSWHIAKPLDVSKMLRISKRIKGLKDFSIFAKEAHTYETCIRHLKNISIKKSKGFIDIDLEASGFLRNMARNIVAFLVKVGCGNISQKEATQILSKNKPYSNKPAPAHGLYLIKVKYA